MATDRISPTMIHPRRVPAWIANLAIVILIAALWPIGQASDLYMNGSYLDLLINIGIAITLAVSLNLINGITGQFSLGHAGFMSIGAYTCGVILKHYSPHGVALEALFLGLILLGGAMAAVAGLVIGIPTLRLRGDYLAIATLGFGEIIKICLFQTDSIGPFEVGGASGLHNIPFISNSFFWTFAAAVLCIVVISRLVYSAKGKPFFAVREDEIAAAAMGIDTTYYKVSAFVIGAFFAGVAGALSASYHGNLNPGGFDFMRSIEIVMMVVLGGSGSITGSILAAIVLTYLPYQLRFFQEWRMVIYALLLIIMMLVRPEGLLGNRELLRTRRRLLPTTLGPAANPT